MSILKKLLTQYDDKRRGFFYFLFRFLFRDPPAIKALRKLNPADKNNIFKIYQCFAENLPKKEELAYFVYKALMKKHIAKFSRPFVLEDIVYLLNFLIKENLTTQNISNLVCEFCGYIETNELTRLLEYLKRSQILTQENFDDMIDPHDFLVMWMVLTKISKTPDFGLLSQEMLALLKRNSDVHLALVHVLLDSNLVNSQNLVRWLQLPENSFLLTHAAFEIVWNRIPAHLLTQAVLDQLMTLSQQENPEQPIQEYVNQLIGFRENQLALNRELVLNHAQSTHRASVHQSVSDSASKLFKRYSLMIEGNRLQDTLQMIHDYIMHLPEGSIKNTAAKNAIERVIHLTFTDPGSNLTIPQLMALSFLAIHDKGKRIGDLSDAREQFVEALYEIQRGYNLSETGHDRGGSDKPICIAGTFNKLIEKLEGIHSDVKVLYISPATASLKLPIVVRDEALDYLASIAQPQTFEGLRRFTHLIEQIRQDECVEAIWEHLKPKVVDQIFAEFGCLYTGKTDPRLIKLVEAGQFVKLEDLSRFQEQIMASPGYQHYCSEILRYSLNFFSQTSAQEVDSSCSARFSFAMSKRAGS